MLVKHADTHPEELLEFSKTWHVLGPFQTGTREATWGADPLEAIGGFRKLEPVSTTYPSSLGNAGLVGWSTIDASPAEHEIHNSESLPVASIGLSVSFPEIDWSSLQDVYGWAALQWQAWARGSLTVYGKETVTTQLYTPGILEFEVDGKRHFGGDLFSFKKAPLLLRLSSGIHVINVRIIRDVRAMGALGSPSVDFKLIARSIKDELFIDENAALYPDYIEGMGFSSKLFSVPIQNTSEYYLEILGAISDDAIMCHSASAKSRIICPGQTTSIGIGLRAPDMDCPTVVNYQFQYRKLAGHGKAQDGQIRLSQICTWRPRKVDTVEVSKLIFERFMDSTASYALVKPPASTNDDDNKIYPVLVVLHGAGVEVDSQQTREMLATIPDIKAWTILPTGGTQWSADDWHTYGLLNVQSAIDAAKEYFVELDSYPSMDISKLFVIGHSNGGQGVWHMLSRMPDKICAAAAVSGYLSIQKYVPYSMWYEADPRISAVLQSSLTAYRHELLKDNFHGIPILQQHGSADSNVPAYHSRRMFELQSQRRDVNSAANVKYNEILGADHWYSGIMATRSLVEFYKSIGPESTHSEVPSSFSIVAPSTGETVGDRGGCGIEQLRTVGQLGRLEVCGGGTYTWTITTTNVLRFHVFQPYDRNRQRSNWKLSINVDGKLFRFEPVPEVDQQIWFSLDDKLREPEWHCTNTSTRTADERSELQYGTINAILKSERGIKIQYASNSEYEVALQISRNLYQYYSVNSTLTHEPRSDKDGSHILVLGKLSTAQAMEVSARRRSRIRLGGLGKVTVLNAGGHDRVYHNAKGAIFLVPHEDLHLDLVIWGCNEEALRTVARLAPGITGVGQPDFIIFGPETSVKGAAGVLAMGFFNHDWSISSASYIS